MQHRLALARQYLVRAFGRAEQVTATIVRAREFRGGGTSFHALARAFYAGGTGSFATYRPFAKQIVFHKGLGSR